MILLDTCILVDLDDYAFDQAQTYGASILSRAELEFGVAAARTPESYNARVQHLSRLDEIFEWLEFDLDCTRAYGHVAANATATGAKVRSKDALIAGQARRFGSAVMTLNTDDFRPFAHLIQVIGPTRR